MEPTEPLNTKFYQLGNGGDLIFEHDLNALSDFLGRPHPEFHGIQMNDQVGGELQWIITADLRGKLEPPTSERILFSIRESNWLDGLARGLQEALARLCGQNVVRLLASRFAHLVRRDAMGVPMALQSHPQLRHHAEHLDYMLYNTQKELDNFRAYANRTHLALVTHGDAIKQLSKDRNKLRLKCAKKDVTITRLRAQIASLESTVKAQEDQLREMEEDEAGADLQGGDAFLSDDDDFEEDEFTEEEDYAFLEPGPDEVVPIDIEDEGSRTGSRQ
jgi:intracellular sulfur oxidation DsrE/DsrF family protein